MEYVNENDQSDEQQDGKYNANDEPYRYACGSSVLNNSGINIGSHFGPTDNLCTLGELCACCSGCIVVYNTVYNPSAGICSIGGAIVKNCIDECLLVYLSVGLYIGVSKNHSTVSLVLDVGENQTCGSFCDLSEICCGNTVKCLACGDLNYDCIIVNGNSRVGNFDLNVSCGHCEGVLAICNRVGNVTVCGLNSNRVGEAILRFNCERNGFANSRAFQNVYVAIGNNVVNMAVRCAYKVDCAVACKQILKSQCGQLNVGNIGLPDVAGNFAVNCKLEVCKCLCPVSKCYCAGGVLRCAGYRAGVEVDGNSGCGIVYTIEADSVAAKLGIEIFAAKPVPAITGHIGSEQAITVSFDSVNDCSCIVINNIILVLAKKSAVCIVVNRIFSYFCIVLNDSSFSGHVEDELVCLVKCNLGTVYLGYVILIAVQRIGLLNGCLNFGTCFVPACDFGGDGSNAAGDCIGIIQISVVDINCQFILINKDDGGEVRSIEGYESVGSVDISDLAVTLIFVYVNECLSVCAVKSVCERKCNFNTLFNKCREFSRSSTIGITEFECKVVSLSAATGSNTKVLCGGSIGSIVESNNVELTCTANKLLQHITAQGYGLCLAVNSGEYELVAHFIQRIKELGVHCKADFLIPTAVEDNLASITFVVKYDVKVLLIKAFDLDVCVGCLIQNVVYINGSNFVFDCNVEDIAKFFCGVNVAEQFMIVIGYCRTERICCVVQIFQVSSDKSALGNVVDDYLLSFDNLTVNGGDNLDNVFTFNVGLNNNVLSGHLVNGFAVFVYPAFKAFNIHVNVNHLAKVNAYGEESTEDNVAVFILERSAENVLYVNANVEACGYVRTVGKQHIKSLVNKLFHLILAVADKGYAICYIAENLLHTLLKNYLCIKGNALCEYECGVAGVEVHQAIVSNNCTESGSQQTLSNLNCICLNTVVNSTCVFYLINYCGVEVCERIVGSCCILEQSLHIEIVTCFFSKLVDNVINGVIKVTVNLCGQMVGDLLADNFFKLFYKRFEGRNGCECMDKVLCFEFVGNVIAGFALNIGDHNLCVARCKNLFVYSAEQSGIYRFENSNNLFKSQAFCKCDEIFGIRGINAKDLILKSVHCGIGGISHLFQSNAENACKFGGDVDVCNQLTVGNANSTDLAYQSGKLCSCGADKIHTGFENKAEGNNLGLFNLTVEVGNFEACAEQLAAVINVCKLGESGNEVGDSIQHTCRVQLGNTVILVTGGDSRTVNLNFGDGGRQRAVNAERLNEICLEVEHTGQLLENAGLVNNLYKLLNVNLVKESTNVDVLDQRGDVNELGDLTVFNDVFSNVDSTNSFDDSLVTL